MSTVYVGPVTCSVTPSIPSPASGKTSKNACTFILCPPYPKKPKIMPPAITDAICPDTFTPTACISKKF